MSISAPVLVLMLIEVVFGHLALRRFLIDDVERRPVMRLDGHIIQIREAPAEPAGVAIPRPIPIRVEIDGQDYSTVPCPKLLLMFAEPSVSIQAC